MLRIYLVGRVMIESPGRLIEQSEFPGRQGRLAFVYLAASPRRAERDQLADVLWGEDLPDAWQSALNAIVSKLRRILDRVGLDGARALEASHGCYELRLPEGTWIDLREAVNSLDLAEGALARGDPAKAWPAAAVASAILRRPFLPGEAGPWVEQIRRELNQLEVRTFDTLAGAWLQAGNAQAAIRAARRAVELAPFRESGYARLMECHLAAGDRAEAVRVYGELRDLLRDSMGLSPAPEVERVYLKALG
ncbi:MAG TPA: BTAD domain-containing putative transcriptional regulator [Jiangellaceae bacterium]